MKPFRSFKIQLVTSPEFNNFLNPESFRMGLENDNVPFLFGDLGFFAFLFGGLQLLNFRWEQARNHKNHLKCRGSGCLNW